MRALTSLSRVVFSRYFTSGLIGAVGVVGLALAGYTVAGMHAALALGLGALAVSFADNPAPMGIKAGEMLFTVVAGSLASSLVWASAGHTGLQLLLIPALGFGAGLVTLWGKRGLAISFCLLFLCIVSLGLPPAASLRAWAVGSALVLLGGLLYTALALGLGHALRRRVKQQALAELLDALSAYMRWQADFFGSGDPRSEADIYGSAALLQGQVNEALQAARDLVLREGREPADAVWSRMLLDALDLFEAQLAAQTDAQLVREAFAGTDVLDELHRACLDMAQALGRLALAVLSNRPAPAAPAGGNWGGVRARAQALRTPENEAALQAPCQALESMLHSLLGVDALILSLHASYAARAVPQPFPDVHDPRLFVSSWRYDPRQLLTHLRLSSPILRHAVRLALALGCALLLTRTLFSRQVHDYWVLLTVAVILRPSYGVTRQRLSDRLLGTVLGCLLVSALLGLNPGLGVQLAVLFLAMTLARTFVTTYYRYTALAASVLALLLAHLLQEGHGFLVAQRLLDTALGAVLAWGFSYVLPHWEYEDAPRQLDQLTGALAEYAEAVLDTGARPEATFRVARKHLFDALAALTGLYARMLDEPDAKRRGLHDLAQLITHGYLLAARLAAMRLLRSQLPQAARSGAVTSELVHTRGVVLASLLGHAGTRLDNAMPEAVGPLVFAPRLALIEQEAARIATGRDQVLRQLGATPRHALD